MDLLGSGREADVYAIGAGRVLRRYRRGDDATVEARLMTYLRGRGFPVPEVFEAHEADLIMERLDGPTMTEAMTAGRLGVAEGAATLIRLHHRLHELPPRLGRAPGDRILHRDLHPDNVMLTARGPVVIDWHNAAEGSPAVDVCLTAIILARVADDPAHPHTAAAREFLAAFLPHAACVPGTGDDPAGREDLAGRGDSAVRNDSAGWDGLSAALEEALEIRRADPALGRDEAARLAATVVPLLRAAAGQPRDAGAGRGQPIVTTRAQAGGRSGS